MRTICAVVVLIAILVTPVRGAHAQADVALVLAVDVSGSVNDARFALQREGIVAALDSAAFAAIVAGGSRGTIEIAVVEWAEEQAVILPWTVVRGREDLAVVAQRLREADRAWVHTKTDPGGGIAGAAALFDGVPLLPDRKVIDVSGDGEQNAGEVPTSVARDIATAQDITINGLPITSGEDPHVDDWYRANVVGGVGSFVVVADGFEAFAEAFQRKVMLEVAGPPTTTALAYLPGPATIGTTSSISRVGPRPH
jgi:uncharacterized protein DUF1194